MKKSSGDFTLRSLLALIVVLGLTFATLHYAGGIYYWPLCERYAESKRLKFSSYHSGWEKQKWPAECFFRDRSGNIQRVEVSTLQQTSGDWVRWLLSWVARILGVGGAVWLASLIGGLKPGRRRG